jgi:hypothetical protein
MSELKNSTNNLSTLDLGTVLRDAHNDKQHALDVNVINSLTPERYSKVTFDLKDMGDGTKEVEFINFYGEGIRQKTKVTSRGYALGRGEITSVSFLSINPTSLAGKYFIVYDNSGSVAIWFNLDGKSAEPDTGTDRNIQIDIVSSDTSVTTANKVKLTIDADSQFNAVNSGSICIIQSSSIGNKTSSFDMDTNLGISTQDGLSSLNNKYFTLYSANDTTEYYVWFNIDTLGTDPSIVGKTGIEVQALSTDSESELGTKIATAIDNNSDFYAEYEDGYINIENEQKGTASNAHPIDSELEIKTTEDGVNASLIMKIQVFFDVDNIISGFEKVY